MTSCEDAPAVAPIQKNEQGKILAMSDFQIAPAGVLASGNVAMDGLKANSEQTVFTVVTDSLPEDWSLTSYLQICKNEQFPENEVVKTIKLKRVEKDLKVDFTDWHDAHVEIFGEDEQGEQTVYYRVYGDVKTAAGATSRFGLTNDYLAKGSLKETPMVSIMSTDFYYTPGGYNGWSQTKSQYLYNLNNKEKPKSYWGMILAKDEFKISSAPNWDGTNYGEAALGELSTTGGNIKTDGTGLYYLTADFDALTYSLTKIEKLSVIGGGDWNTDRFLTPNEDFSVWTGEAKIDGDWLIRVNGGWDIKLANDLKNPTPYGNNFEKVSGTFQVTVTFSGHHPVIKLEKK